MDARFRSNLEMIGRNEPITKKAKFWQSYVRALKGTDDMRAPEHTRRPRGIFGSDYPELHSSWNPFKSIYDDPIHAADRIHTPGYRYLPMHREIYGYSPRAIYPHQYKPVERFVPGIPSSKEARLNHLDMPPAKATITDNLTIPSSKRPIFDHLANLYDLRRDWNARNWFRVERSFFAPSVLRCYILHSRSNY